MNIGVDLDGVVYNSENWLSAVGAVFDHAHQGHGIIDPTQDCVEQRYGWDEATIAQFHQAYWPAFMQQAPLMPYAPELLRHLQAAGHRILLITARGTKSPTMALTREILQRDGIPFDELHFSPGNDNKVKICQARQVAVMIDDNAQIITQVAAAGIPCLHFRNGRTKTVDDPRVTTVCHWGEIYHAITALAERKNG